MTGTLDIEINRIKRSKIDQVDFKNIKFGKVYSDHMFISDFDKEWADFRIIPYGNLSLSPGTSVIHYGQSIFEGLKAHKNEKGEILVFRPFDNHKRMNVSAERMCIPAIPEEVFMGGLTRLIELDKSWVPDQPGTSLYIRPYMFATDEYIGIRPSDTFKFIIFSCPVGAYYSKPVKVKVETYYSRSFEGGTGFAKAAGNYAVSLYPMVMAQKQGYDQLIWTDGKTHQYIEESGTMNIMFVIDDTLITAPAGNTILKGITRHSVLTLARDWGYKVDERRVTVAEVIDAIKSNRLQEAFGTGTAATIAHIKTIGHEGTDYELPPVEEREFSNKVFNTLEDLKYGRIEDKFGWIYKIK
ncbi:MAG: branched-chain amino acid aminotransferase [Candidatus Cyclobacteriaceae bacterium M3_2C_046]